MRRLLSILFLVIVPSLSQAEIPIRAERIATGLSKPLYVTSAPGDPNRLYILEQRGTGGVSTSGGIRIFDYSTGTLNSSPFLTMPSLTTNFIQGALGMTFHPDYATNGRFYVNVTANGTETQIRQYTRVNSSTASTTFSTVLNIPRPSTEHNGGWMGFGPNDGHLYILSGDGGNTNDEGPGHTAGIGNALDITNNLMGKVLRLNVNGDDFPADANRNYSIPSNNPFAGVTTGDDEIWAYGLRNPWRASFDRGSSSGAGRGDFYIGDPGENLREEIDFQPANSSGGENYGWRAKEGSAVTGLTPVPSPVVDPIHEYANTDTDRAVTGGYVYRGSENDALAGTYIFGDYQSHRIWGLKHDGTEVTKFREMTGNITFAPGQGIGQISSFGEDAYGRLYVTDISDGEVYRLVPAHPGDADLDGFVDATDLGIMALSWQQGSGATWADGDFTDDGKVDAYDLMVLATNWLSGPVALHAALVENGLPPGVVPEPGAAGLALLLLLRRRRR